MVAFIDVDGLKAYNDTRGHQAGDELLRGVVAAIQLGLRTYDLIVRYGGDEFVCSLAGQAPSGIRERFDRINDEIAGAFSGTGISVGLAEASKGATLEVLMAEADRAMMAGKRHQT